MLCPSSILPTLPGLLRKAGAACPQNSFRMDRDKRRAKLWGVLSSCYMWAQCPSTRVQSQHITTTFAVCWRFMHGHGNEHDNDHDEKIPQRKHSLNEMNRIIILIRTGNCFASTVLRYLIGTPLVAAKTTVCNDNILTINTYYVPRDG